VGAATASPLKQSVVLAKTEADGVVDGTGESGLSSTKDVAEISAQQEAGFTPNNADAQPTENIDAQSLKRKAEDGLPAPVVKKEKLEKEDAA
jgi:hypothetical protein